MGHEVLQTKAFGTFGSGVWGVSNPAGGYGYFDSLVEAVAYAHMIVDYYLNVPEYQYYKPVIELFADVTEYTVATYSYEINKRMSINLNGHTFTHVPSNPYTNSFSINNDFEIYNGRIVRTEFFALQADRPTVYQSIILSILTPSSVITDCEFVSNYTICYVSGGGVLSGGSYVSKRGAIFSPGGGKIENANIYNESLYPSPLTDFYGSANSIYGIYGFYNCSVRNCRVSGSNNSIKLYNYSECLNCSAEGRIYVELNSNCISSTSEDQIISNDSSKILNSAGSFLRGSSGSYISNSASLSGFGLHSSTLHNSAIEGNMETVSLPFTIERSLVFGTLPDIRRIDNLVPNLFSIKSSIIESTIGLISQGTPLTGGIEYVNPFEIYHSDIQYIIGLKGTEVECDFISNTSSYTGDVILFSVTGTSVRVANSSFKASSSNVFNGTFTQGATNNMDSQGNILIN